MIELQLEMALDRHSITRAKSVGERDGIALFGATLNINPIS
jgi:hypothetical protein